MALTLLYSTSMSTVATLYSTRTYTADSSRQGDTSSSIMHQVVALAIRVRVVATSTQRAPLLVALIFSRRSEFLYEYLYLQGETMVFGPYENSKLFPYTFNTFYGAKIRISASDYVYAYITFHTCFALHLLAGDATFRLQVVAMLQAPLPCCVQHCVVIKASGVVICYLLWL